MIKIKAFLLPLALLFCSTLAFANEPLQPEVAFKFDAVVEGNTIKATWTAADGYYMYKDKIRFEAKTEGTELGEPSFPKGKIKHGIRPDGTEGDVETYMKSVTIDVPVKASKGGAVTIIAHSQGCAEELGICYPPQKREKTLTLAEVKAASGVQGISELSSQLGLDANTPLPPEEAFKLNSRIEGDKLLVTWTIANDYYMYREKFSVKSDSPSITFGAPEIPKGKLKHGIKPDGTEGEVEVYTKEVTISYPIIASKADVSKIKFFAEGQGCAETLGICYPPQKRAQSLNIDTALAANSKVAKESLWDTIGRIALAFLAGLGLTFTPCVLPMLPIISSIIAGQGENVTKARGGMLATVYVLGTAVIWTAAGYVAGATGEQLQAYTSHPYFLIPVAVVIFVLSLAMFGLFNLQMPSFLQSKAQESSTNLKGGTVAGVFMMGVLASVIAGACVSPILILNLGIALDTHDPILGAWIMFAMAMGMGVPIILVGIGAGWLLPKAGTWMDAVKYVFGVILIGLAIFILSKVDWMPVLYLWAPFLIITGVYMGGTQPLADGVSGWKYLWKGTGLFLIAWGVFALLGAMQGNKDILAPVQLGQIGTTTSKAVASDEYHDDGTFNKVKTMARMEQLLTKAKTEGKPAIVDYYATWCTDCNLMENSVFSQPDVQSLLKGKFVLIKPDVSNQFDKETQPMKDRFKIFGPPALIFIDANGNERKDLSGIGKLTKEEFISRAKAVLNP